VCVCVCVCVFLCVCVATDGNCHIVPLLWPPMAVVAKDVYSGIR
jgi:hypothetical protein